MHYWTQVLLELAFAKALVVKQTPEQQEPHMCVCVRSILDALGPREAMVVSECG